LRRLFFGRRPAAVRFQFGLFTLDLAAVAYFLATTFVREALWLREADLLLGALLACEFLGRLLAHRDPTRRLDDGASW
jgi:voltage-gated potassium channel